MDDTRTTFVGLIAAALLAVMAGLVAQLFVDEQRIDSDSAESIYANVACRFIRQAL